MFRYVAVLVLVAACARGEERSGQSDTGLATTEAVTTTSSGEQLYQQRCVSCHQADGQGLPGSFPPLAQSEYATAANPVVPVRVLIHGISGPITVKGAQYTGVMPAYGVGVEMSDDEVAAVLTYVRGAWGNQASPVTVEDVARTRGTPRSQIGAVTAEELKALM